jgi:hypothetical protein
VGQARSGRCDDHGGELAMTTTVEMLRQQNNAARAELLADVAERRAMREAAGAYEPMPMRQPTRDRVIHKAKADAAVVPVPPPFSAAQRAALHEFVRERIDVVIDVLGAETGTLQRFERERLDSEMTAMRAMIEALRSEVQRLRAEVAHEVEDSANVTAMKGRSDAA